MALTIHKKTPIREEILNVAADLFYREGIRAVGIDRIIDEANIAKATLYRHFPSKNELVATYLNERHERVIQSFDEVLRTIADPRKQIAAIFDMLYKKADSPDFRGCAFSLAVAEHRDSEQVVRVAREHKAAIRAIIGAVMARGGAPSGQSAAHIALLYEGALATVAVSSDPRAVLVAKDCALAVFDFATTRQQDPGDPQANPRRVTYSR
ncbi:TetR/AcrR family transcriptional regulator [Pseudochelatococcus contaminans]|uniref:TetR/AcrR family transcriptional regulator n=1 Tax=Pseudochelatococcus contaminans TaxID=1538103 RepID=UPI00161192DA|nr:TetR/AcrR family transcriptional regulator [Pseudochelatococcus contaminans]